MTEFREQDLTGSRFERVSLRQANFRQVFFTEAAMHQVDLSGVQIRGAYLQGLRMRGVELIDVEISGELQNVVINGVDVAPLIEAELNRRTPERALMRPDDAEGFRRAWEVLDRLWEQTLERGRALPVEALHLSVDDEWSFIQTLRHLNFASAAWVGRMVLGNPTPWHPLDLPWDEAEDMEGVPWDRDARPSLDEVVAVRRERQAMVRDALAELTDAQLTENVSHTEPGWPLLEDFPLRECLLIVLNEEWEHRGFAERDLAKITAGTAAPTNAEPSAAQPSTAQPNAAAQSNAAAADQPEAGAVEGFEAAAFPHLVQSVIDTTQVRDTAEFYRELFGLVYRPGDEPLAIGPDDAEWLVLLDPDGGRSLAFQQVDQLTPTTWPSAQVPMQLHLDFSVPTVDDLERHRERALSLGARLIFDRRDDPQEPLYVFADPAGHPFCIFVHAPEAKA